MSVVGRAYVTVRAITRQVQGDIEGGVDKALGNVEAKSSEKLGQQLGTSIGDGIESSGIDKSIDDSVRKYDAKKGGRALGKKLGEGVAAAGSTAAFDEFERDARIRGRDIGARLGDAMGESLFGETGLDRAFRRVTGLMQRHADRDGPSIGMRLAGGVAKGIGKIAISPITWIGALALPAVSDALSAVNALLASTTSLAGTLGPALGATGAIGASGLTALLTTIGTVTLALKTQSNQLDDLKTSLLPVRDEWRGFGRDTQRVLLPALSAVSERLTVALGPTVRDGMVGTARALAGVTRQFARMGEQASFQDRLGQTLDSNATAMRSFGSAGLFGLSSMLSITAAAGPLTNRFAAWTDEVVRSWDAQLRAAEASGRLTEWFDRAGDVTATWGRILGDVGRALGNTFSIGMGEGAKLLDMLEGVTTRWEDWTESIEGESRIADWFESATPVMSAFGSLLDGLTQGVQNWAGGNEVAAESLETIAGILPPLGTALGAVTTVARELLRAVAPSVEEIATLGPTVVDLARDLGSKLAPALDSAVPPLVDMVEAALEIVGAFTPAIPILGDVAGIVGSVLAPALETTAAALDAIPGPILGVLGSVAVLRVAFSTLSSSARLGPMVTGVRTSLGAIRTEMALTSGAATRMKVGLSGAMGLMGGPWGMALGVGTLALGAFMQKNAEADAAIDEFTSTLDENTGAITRNSREWASNQLLTKGVLEDAKLLGLNLADVTEAALGNEDALARVNAQLDETRRALPGLKMPFTEAGNTDTAIGNVSEALTELNGVVNKGTAEWQLMDEANRGNNVSVSEANGLLEIQALKQHQVSVNTGRSADETRRQKDETKGLTDATLSYHEATLKLLQGQLGFEQSMISARKEINEGRKTLDIHTQAGIDNMNALLGVAQAAGSVEGSAKKQQAALDRARTFIAKWADEAGYGEKQAERFANRLIGLAKEADNTDKKSIDIPIHLRGVDKATEDLRILGQKLAEMDGREARTYVTTVFANQGYQTLGGPQEKAEGGWIRGAGSSTSDSIVYNGHGDRVSNMEFVVNARDAQRNADLLEAINAGKDVMRPIRVAAGGRQVNVTVNNPLPERTRQSVQSSLNGIIDDSGWGY